VDENKRKEMTRAVLAAAREENGRRYLKCAEAWRLAGKFGVKPVEIGRLCQQHDVKVTACQLGLFR